MQNQVVIVYLTIVASPKTNQHFDKVQNEDKVMKFDTESRRRMMKSMTDSKQAPYFIYNDEWDITKLVEMQNNPDMFPKEITMLAVVIKALSIGLISYPMFNKTVVYNSMDQVEIKGSTRILIYAVALLDINYFDKSY